MLLRKLALLSLLFFSFSANAQYSCGFDAYRTHLANIAQEKQVDKQLAKHPVGTQKTILTFPVVVHVVHQNGPENIPDAAITNALGELNERLLNSGQFYDATGHDVQIQVCLATVDPAGNPTTGITRTQSALTNMQPNYASDEALKNLIRWAPELYCNIWVVNDVNILGVSGYAANPSSAGTTVDGIVAEAAGFTSYLLVHEVGHYLGLYHTYEGGCTNFNCSLDGDRVCDTPPDATQWTCQENTCNTDLDDTTGMAPPTDLPELPNYMDYSTCTVQSFTQGQSDRMNASLATLRADLLLSNGCGQFPGGAVPQASFTFNPGTCYSFVFTNTSTDGVSAQWDFNSDGTIDACGNTVTYSFPATGNYTVTMITTGFGGMDTTTQTLFAQVTPNQHYPMVNGFNGVVLSPNPNEFHFCPGATVEFYGVPGMVSYLWSTGQTTQNLNFQPTDTFVVTLTAVDANGLTWTNCYPINVRPVPPPALSIAGNDTVLCIGDELTLLADFGYYMTSNAWYDNDGLIAGQNDTDYTVTLEDTNNFVIYQHESTGCNTWSDTLTIIADSCDVSGLPEWASGEWMLFPNPASDQLTLQQTGAAATRAAVTVFAVDGTRLLSETATGKLMIDVSEWNAGMYLIKIQSEASLQTIRLVIR
jgi:PKD repeat protein